MSRFQALYRRAIVAGVLCQMVAGTLSLSAQAEQVLVSSDEPLQVTLNTGLNVENAHFGDSFEAALTEPCRYQNKELPAGTLFKGQVRNARPSMMFGMPGFVALDVKEVTFPSGEAFQFDADGKSLKAQKIIHPKAHTKKGLAQSALPFTAISAVDTIPLKYAAGFGSWQILPISLAARMALGVALEKTKSEKANHAAKNHPVQTRVGHGLLRGTGLPGAYYFVKPSPEPVLTAGSTIPLRFGKNELSALFASVPQTASAGGGALSDTDSHGLKPIESEQQEFSDVYAKLGKTPTANDAATPSAEPASHTGK